MQTGSVLKALSSRVDSALQGQNPPALQLFMRLFQHCQGPPLSLVNFSEWPKDKLLWLPNSVVHSALKTGSSVAAKALPTTASIFLNFF